MRGVIQITVSEVEKKLFSTYAKQRGQTASDFGRHLLLKSMRELDGPPPMFETIEEFKEYLVDAGLVKNANEAHSVTVLAKSVFAGKRNENNE